MKLQQKIDNSVNFLGEKPLQIRKENLYYVNSYLNEVKKRSNDSYRNHKSVLNYFFQEIDKKIPDITMIDVRNYFDDYLDKRDIKLDSKETYRSVLMSFFYYVQALLLNQKIEFRNPVPIKRVYQFTQKDTDIKKQSEKEDEILSKEQLEMILDYCKKNLRRRDFILFGLIACTGARISEIRTIKTKDVDLEERYFETGFIKGARKSTYRQNKALLFFFTEKFMIYLKNYILTLKDKKNWLFTSNKKGYLSNTQCYFIKKKIIKKLGFEFTFHSFRRAIITYYTKNNISSEVREMLMNHKSSSIEGEHYLKLSIEEKRDLYDKFFPYYEISYF